MNVLPCYRMKNDGKKAAECLLKAVDLAIDNDQQIKAYKCKSGLRSIIIVYIYIYISVHYIIKYE